MADEDLEFQEGEGRQEGDEGAARGSEDRLSASGQVSGSVEAESSAPENEPSPTTEGDPPIIVQGGGST